MQMSGPCVRGNGRIGESVNAHWAKASGLGTQAALSAPVSDRHDAPAQLPPGASARTRGIPRFWALKRAPAPSNWDGAPPPERKDGHGNPATEHAQRRGS